MSHVRHADRNRVVDLDHLPVRAGVHQAHQPRHVVQIVKRFDLMLAFPLSFTALPLSLGDLDVGAVAQHDIAQGHRRLRRKDRAAKALLIQQREQPCVVDMRVRQQHKIQRRRRHGQRLVFVQILSLLHAVVHKTFFVADFDIGATAGHFMRRAEKADLHPLCLLSKRFFYFTPISPRLQFLFHKISAFLRIAKKEII